MFPHLTSLHESTRTGLSTRALPISSWDSLVSSCKKYSGGIEFFISSFEQLHSLQEYLSTNPLGNRYTSIHCPPTLQAYDFHEMVNFLIPLSKQVNTIIMHPDTLADFDILQELGETLVLKNLGANASIGRTPEELNLLFQLLPQAYFCLDLRNVLVHDETMQLGHELLDALGNKLRQYHLSGIGANNAYARLTEGEAKKFMPLLARHQEAKWILETLLTPIPYLGKKK